MHLAALLLGLAVALVATAWLARRYADRLGRRAALRFRSRIDRYKLARRRFVRERLLADAAIADAVREHATANDVSEADAWKRVNGYVTEIVPFLQHRRLLPGRLSPGEGAVASVLQCDGGA
jgi:hypothetical protein